MHEISRHSIHVSEVLAVSIQTFGKILEQLKKVHAKLPVALTLDAREQAYEDVDFQIQMLRSLKERSISNYSRLTSEITVVCSRFPFCLQGRILTFDTGIQSDCTAGQPSYEIHWTIDHDFSTGHIHLGKCDF